MYFRMWRTVLALVLAAAAVLPAAVPAAAQAPTNAWAFQMWLNRDLAGDPVLEGQVPELRMRWGLGGQADLPPDNFSARFTRSVSFPGGPVRFYARADDGVRVWVDDRLLIDRWYDHPAAEIFTAATQLTRGTHTIRVDYYEHLDRAELEVWWEATPPEAQGAWTAEYWPNESLTGVPQVITGVPEVNFRWSLGSPEFGIPADRFSARFTRTVQFPAGDYRFFANVDDGVRLWVDGWLLIDQWTVGAERLLFSDFQNLGAGPHTIRIEYFERSSAATLQVWWQRIGEGATGGGGAGGEEQPWQGEYFANRTLQGTPAVTTQDPVIAYDWGRNPPYAGLPADNFSVRWTKQVNLAAGDYEFTTVADDGVRVYIDGQRVIDSWSDGPARISQNVFRGVGAGSHTITVEYYEATELAVVNFRWRRL